MFGVGMNDHNFHDQMRLWNSMHDTDRQIAWKKNITQWGGLDGFSSMFFALTQ